MDDVARKEFEEIGETLHKTYEGFFATFNTPKTDYIRNMGGVSYQIDPELRKKIDANKRSTAKRLKKLSVIIKYSKDGGHIKDDDDEESDDSKIEMKHRRKGK
ncbi:hypothetical protein Btru_058517 [Bulinus truncatus]|nr:hypothetical protein Btru_058517 [Bulinus truncatus]